MQFHTHIAHAILQLARQVLEGNLLQRVHNQRLQLHLEEIKNYLQSLLTLLVLYLARQVTKGKLQRKRTIKPLQLHPKRKKTSPANIAKPIENATTGKRCDKSEAASKEKQ